VASSAAKRYAEAIFGLGQERGNLDDWQRDLDLLANVVADKRIAASLKNPTVAADRKVAVIEDALAGEVQPETRNLIRLLVEHNRTTLTPEIRDVFADKVREARGIVVAEATTADPLHSSERELVREKLEQMTGLRVELTTRIDPDIIGGIVIRIGDQVIDGSVRNKLERMRMRLVAGRA
jgi:F-type H+-transporting ATPase subunit delta